MNRFQDFDTHSTVAMSFDNIGDLFVEAIDGDVWMWNIVANEPMARFDYAAPKLLAELVQPAPWSRTGQLQLGEDEGKLVLRCILSPHSLASAADLGASIEGFFLRAARTRDILQ
ncbi:hypothetical protein [Pinirhizobacter sp.]|uniref:InvB/SpaK family type III secretion system chaperone n=1 Tax=Pinirhizobacter sp. TaxID=2950432 RepID=UPI002F3EB957